MGLLENEPMVFEPRNEEQVFYSCTKSENIIVVLTTPPTMVRLLTGVIDGSNKAVHGA